MYDERLSTQEAIRRVADEPRGAATGVSARCEADTDAIAASIILQAFLDRQRFRTPRLDERSKPVISTSSSVSPSPLRSASAPG